MNKYSVEEPQHEKKYNLFQKLAKYALITAFATGIGLSNHACDYMKKEIRDCYIGAPHSCLMVQLEQDKKQISELEKKIAK